MTSPYEHLQHNVRPIADEDNDSRIRRIRSDRRISYGRAESAITALENLLSFPKRTRMPNLLLVGPTNNGKTMIVEKFRRSHPPTPASATSRGVADFPVLKIQMPEGPDVPQFFGAVLEEMAFPHLLSDRGSKRKEAAVRLMQDTEVRMLIIDEVHNLLSGSRLQQRRLLNLLRWLGNELKIPLVAVGTAEALHAIQSDDQLANRFEPIALPPWRSGKECQLLLKTLEAVLPLRCPSELAKPAIANKIVSASEGILGEVVSMVTRAAILAILTGEECISAKLLDDTGFIAPSERRRVAV